MITIRLICLMEGDFEFVQYKGTHKNFVDNIQEGRLVRIYDEGKEIFINPDYIMSFEFGEESEDK